jgi:hypothetical protein
MKVRPEGGMSEPTLCGRAGLARILDVSERTARNVEDAGDIEPEMVVGGRPLFSVAKAHALRERREAERLARLRQRLERRAPEAA